MLLRPVLDQQSDIPLYRQLSAQIRAYIDSGKLSDGEKLPATRELAEQLGLNRTTVSAAYALLETEGFLRGHVGRGSFVNAPAGAGAGVSWDDLLVPRDSSANAFSSAAGISFTNSCPSEMLFPMEEFRATCREVIEGPEAQALLQLGSPSGYAPLRRYLIERAQEEGAARPGDDIIVTSGVQQAYDLIQRVLVSGGETILLEDPVYSGLRNAFSRAGAKLVGIPVTANGIDLAALERALVRERPRLLAITSNFQNPTGASLPLEARAAIVRMAAQHGVIVIENDIYGELRYEGEALPTLKQVDARGDVVLLRSFSKLAFPGLRVGWIIAPRALVSRLAEVKQYSDIHTDQLAQAVLLRFAESGRLHAHREHVREAGLERLHAAIGACERYLPPGARFTRPSGGMNLWVRLPEPLDAVALLPRAQSEGVSYLPGRHFAVSRVESGSLRLSFAHLPPKKIRAGIAILGRVFSGECESLKSSPEIAATALV
jgi:2-aminoadipate transaminase